MTNSKSTKRALVTSALAIFMCVAMLIGTTFAWFTDTASTAVNKIQAGTLDIQLIDEDGNDLEGTTLEFKKSADAPTGEAILWEPGCTYELPAIRIKNNGNLALKYKVQITGLDGDAKLLEAIEWTIDGVALDTELQLAAGATSNALTIKGHMKDDAGNEYQGLSIDGIAITVIATQDTVEYDSNNNTYDENAQYPDVSYAVVGTSEELANAITNAKDANGAETNKVVAKLSTSGTYALPALENKEVTIVGDTDTVIDMKDKSNKASSAELDGVKVEFSNANYCGFKHTGKLVYKNCTISGLQTLYADEVEFINCTFEQTAADVYHLWTYGAKNVTFTDCKFISTENSKAVLCYADGVSGETLTRTFNNCTFTCDAGAEKSAIMINPTANGSNTYVININNCTATGYGTNETTGSSLVGVKQTPVDNITINIDGATFYTHAN